MTTGIHGSKTVLSSAVVLFSVLALFSPLSHGHSWLDWPIYQAGPVLLIAFAAMRMRRRRITPGFVFLGTLTLIVASVISLVLLHRMGLAGKVNMGYWFYVIAITFFAWGNLADLSAISDVAGWLEKILMLLIPALFGAGLIWTWEVIVTGFAVPQVLLPSPGIIATAFAASTHTLAADFHQTFIRAVIPGFVLGNCAGFLVALIADRIPFLQRGLLPFGNLISAIPIVGIAPIMVMWFGFDWQSKAAVVVIMTFFPMLVNTIIGLAEVGKMEKDLMHSYAAEYRQELRFLRLPNALPFVFNALKINSTLAMIGAIVAEFFGTPIVGMGFRISTEVGRMNIDMVWATILVAALSGSLFYGIFAIMERWFTFWHPSFRKQR